MATYGYCGGLCVAVAGLAVDCYVWLWRTMYSCGGLSIAMEGYLWLWRAICGCGGLFIAMEGYALLWRAMYSCGGLCKHLNI